MQLFCVSSRVPGVDERSLSAVVRKAGDAFPQLARGEPWAVTSSSSEVVVAAFHHPAGMVGPRSYHARKGDVVVAFDGWPVHRFAGWPGHDAAALLANWSELTNVAEGQFSALRVDLDSDDISFVTDAFGIAPLYHASCDGGHLVANSVEVLRLAARLDEPSLLGVSSFAALGWPTGETTLLAGVQALAGGSEYRLSGAGLTRRPYFTPAQVAAGARSSVRFCADEVASELVSLTASAAEGGGPVDCGLTAGRDTRLLLALILASGAGNVRYFTGGREGDGDVEGARQVASAVGIRHELRSVDALDKGDPGGLAKTFVSQTDGLSSLIQIGDLHDQLVAPRTLGLKVTGLGGEIGRCGVRTGPYAANVPLLTCSARVQQELILERARAFRTFMTADARRLVSTHVRAFTTARLSEGWGRRELGEAHYAFDRVPRWGSTGVRRLAAIDDLFSPYCSRIYANYCFSLTPDERYLEAPHYRILTSLSPTLRDVEFSKRWRRQEPARARLLASADLARSLVRRRRRGIPSPAQAAIQPYWVSWFDSNLREHRELCLSVPGSPLWSLLDRAAVERAFAAEQRERARLREGLTRVLTLFWYFHGRHAF
ncbi:MAG TPA: hypothetical protein VH108_11300 [Gaiellaceae bacterium]|nr:hypothetical protein [Gaiellaceae bacterium]